VIDQVVPAEQNIKPGASLKAAQVRTHWISYLFCLPALLLMFIILLVPIVVAGYLSFTDYSLGNDNLNWLGWENYETIFGKSSYQKMIYATVTYVMVVVPVSIGLGLGAALLINDLSRFSDVYKAIYFLPVMAALLAMALVWDMALHPTVGIVNQTLRTGCETWIESLLSFGWLPWVDGAESWYSTSCADEFPLWIGDRDYALPTICFIGIWQAFGFNMVLYLAGLTGVPRELYHAASIDGVTNGWDRFRLVTWPMLGPTTVFVVTITAINSFKVFDTVEALTWGGPAKSTYVMMYAIFEKAVKENLVGFGSAITIVFLAFVLIITFTQRYVVEKRVHY
jgi:multiple sugar transport system permease protein